VASPDDRFGQSQPGSQLDWAGKVFFFSFAPKWFNADGRSFNLVFTGGVSGIRTIVEPHMQPRHAAAAAVP
jgi:hypothetical protein